MEIVMDLIQNYGYVAIVLLLALGVVGLPIPDEILMIFIGYLCSIRLLSYFPSILFGIIGSLLGMLVSYYLGRKIGFILVEKYGKWIGLTPKRYFKLANWFTRYGDWGVFIGYFIPGGRHAVGAISGITKMAYKKYFFLSFMAALVWTVVFVSIGYFVGIRA